MFTGIITDIGTLAKVEAGEQSRRLIIHSHDDPSDIAIGASIAHDGCCLTVTESGTLDGEYRMWHSVDVSSHTLEHTTLGTWEVGRQMNLERALRMGDELGGHMVSGHIDGLATIQEITREDASVHYVMEAPDGFDYALVDKGSVTLDGVSLTITWAKGNQFGLTLIPHTMDVTTWQHRRIGDQLNFEADMLARYIRNMVQGSAA